MHVKVNNMATEGYMAMSFEQYAVKLQRVQADFCRQQTTMAKYHMHSISQAYT